MSVRTVILTGMFLAGTSVILGAFGAHWLREQLPLWYPLDAPRRLESWQTGVTYQMFHALALIAGGGLATACWRWRGLAAAFMLLGVVLFSGGLYGWVLTDQRWMVMVVPIGGVSFIAGWVCAMASVAFGPSSCSSGGGCHEH